MQDRQGKSTKRFAKLGIISMGLALLLVLVAWRISFSAEGPMPMDFGLLRASSPVTARPPEPQGTAVSPLLGWQPQGETGSGILPPGLATGGQASSNGTTTSPRYRPGVVKQFEETSYYLQDTDFTSSTTGWAVGYPHWDQAAKVYTATVIQTTDGGETWITQTTGISAGLYSVDFVSNTEGWAVGASGSILRTSDGGATWIDQSLPITDELRSVRFVDTNHGWTTSVRPIHYDSFGDADNWEAAVWYTGDGGETWTQQTVPEGASILHAVDFVGAHIGWAVGVKYVGDDQYGRPEHRAVVYRTDDGGETWYERYNPDLEISLTCVDFLDANHGWVAGFPTRSSVTGGAVFSTSDGGETWEHHEPGGSIYAPLWDIEFLDQDRGYVVGANYVAAWGPPVWRTLDGGETWEEIAMDQHENDGLFGLAVMEDRAIALGDHDYVITSTDPWGTYEWPHGENLFTQAFINIHYRFEDVFFLDEDTGWAVGSRSFIPEHTGQVILHTADGGLTWKTQYEQAPLFDLFSVFRLDSVYFVDDQTGWAVGRSEYDESNDPHWAILYTSDGGLHWEEQGQELCEDVSPEFFAVQFLDGLHGWALDKGHYDRDNDMHALFLAHTTDGGATWEWVSTEITGSMSVGFALVQGDVAFTDEQHGWAVGGLGKVIYTCDGGVHWERQDFAEDWRRLFAIEMLDNQEGWIGGEGLFHTRDGGAHWTMEDVDIGGDVQDVQFVDALNGWLAGARGRILVTRDGGDTWHEVDNNVSSFTLLGLSFVDQDKGWLVGDYGTILTTTQIPYWPVYLPLVMQV